MSLITISQFFNEFNIGQKGQSTVAEKLQYYIDTYEPEYIEKAIGEDFAALFNASPLEPRFDDLEAMFKADPSPIVGYVFYHYQRDSMTQSGGAGDTRSAVENGKRTPEIYRMTVAWNIMVDKTRKIRAYLKKNATIFPEYNLYDTDLDLTCKINVMGL